MRTLLIALSSFFLWECGGAKTEKKIQDIVNQPGTILVDVRTPEEYEESHIDGSVNIPLAVLTDSIQFLKQYENIVVFCAAGKRSARAADILKSAGFDNVFDGGGRENIAAALESAC